MPEFFTPREDHSTDAGQPPSRPESALTIASPVPPRGFTDYDLPPEAKLNVGMLIRRYGLLAIILPLVGLMAGAAIAIRKIPLYRSRLVAEVQGVSEAFLRNSADPYAPHYEASAVNLQTQIKLLESGLYTKRISDRIRQDFRPIKLERKDIFGKLHERLLERGNDPVALTNEALLISSRSFSARPINGTRLIELICESTQPEVAASYLNLIAEEFVEDTLRSHSKTSQKTSAWLSNQFVETKTALKNAEDRLQAFLQSSGGFSGAETLDDTKLKQLQGDLAQIQSARIAKQTRWESLSRASGDSLPDGLKDLRWEQMQTQLNDLRQQRGVLLMTLTENHYKVKAIDSRIRDTEAEFKKLQKQIVGSALNQARVDYDAALRQEQLLQGAYRTQSRNIAGLVDKASELNGLKREVDTLRQTHDSLLQRLNQIRSTSSLAVEPILVVEPAQPSDQPFTQNPYASLAMGFLGGLAGVVAIAFLREKMDKTVHSPGALQAMFQIPELGSIPAIKITAKNPSKSNLADSQVMPLGVGTPFFSATGLNSKLVEATWTQEDLSVAESFRATMISLIRVAGKKRKNLVSIVTSAEPGDGKTTVVSNLGIALSEASNSILLIDADFRRSSLHKIFSLSNDRGISNILNDPRPISEIPVEEFIQPTGVAGLFLLSSGGVIDNISAVLQSQRFEETIKVLKTLFAVTLIDTPPALLFADARMLGRHSDGAVVVVRAEKTSADNAASALRALVQSGVPVLGTILNGWKSGKKNAGEYFNYYNRDRDN